MSYWTRARSWAVRNTKLYTLPKAIPTIVASLAQWLFFRMRPLTQTLITVGTIIGGYILLYLLEFGWKLLFMAPAALDRERAAELNQLQQTASATIAGHERSINEFRAQLQAPKISPFEQSQRRLLAAKLNEWTDQERSVLRFLLRHEAQDRGQLMRTFDDASIVDAVTSKGNRDGIIQYIRAQGQHTRYGIEPTFVEALKVHFHGG